MKHIKKIILLFILIPCAFILSACSFSAETAYITDIKRTGTNTYIITYSDGETTKIEVANDDPYIVSIEKTTSNTYLVTYSNGEHETLTLEASVPGKYIVSFEKSSSTTTKDIYTITYSDNSTSTFTVLHGKDGKNLTLSVIEEYCEKEGITVEDFLDSYFDLTLNENPIKTASNIAMQSAVSIYVEHTVDTTSGDKTPSLFAGSGSIYEMNEDYSYIITNFHVVSYEESLDPNQIANKIIIYQYGVDNSIYKQIISDTKVEYSYSDNAIEAEFVGGTDKYDLAILKVPTESLKNNNLTAQAVTVANKYSLGEYCFAAGNPKGHGLSITEGIISVLSEEIEIYKDNKNYVTHRVLRTDAAINGGNSGGGLFNINGELIGVVNAKLSSIEIDNMGYAIPVDTVTKIAENIIYHHKLTGKVANPKQITLGISYIENNFRTVYDKTNDEIYLYNDCVIAAAPTANGIGSKLGFKAGDIIKSISVKHNGTVNTITFTQSHLIPESLLTIRAGDTISFVVSRNGNDVTLGNLETFVINSSYFVECDDTSYIKQATD